MKKLVIFVLFLVGCSNTPSKFGPGDRILIEGKSEALVTKGLGTVDPKYEHLIVIDKNGATSTIISKNVVLVEKARWGMGLSEVEK